MRGGWVRARLSFAFFTLLGCACPAYGCGSDDGGGEPQPDGGPGPSLPEAGEDAARDGGPPGDADAGSDATDARPEVDGGPAFCASLSPAPKFCDDFDEGVLGAKWTVKTELAGFSSLAFDPNVFRSAPIGLRASSNAPSPGDGANASLRKTILEPCDHVKLAWSARLSATTLTSGTVALANIGVSLDRLFTLYLRDDDPTAPAAILEEVGPGVLVRHLLTKVPPVGVWTRIVIDLDLIGGTVTVSYDGGKALDADPITAGAGSEVTVRLGNVYVFGPLAAPFVGHYDDVVIDY